MLRSILVPVDGSRFSERAVPVAARLAQETGSTLHLVMAHDPIAGIGPFAELGPPNVLLMEKVEGRERTYLEQLAARLRRQSNIKVKIHWVDGIAGRVITRMSATTRAGLVVMATHGRGAMGPLGLGSVADHVVRHVHLPVLLIPRKAASRRKALGRRVLVPLDLSGDATDVLRVLEQLRRRTRNRMRIQLLHVVVPVLGASFPFMPFPISETAQVTELRWTQARQALARVKKRAARQGVISTRVVAGGSPAARILEVFHQGPFDLLAITTHGRRGLRRLLLGSVASKVIRHAKKPVLVLRPRPRSSGRRAKK